MKYSRDLDLRHMLRLGRSGPARRWMRRRGKRIDEALGTSSAFAVLMEVKLGNPLGE